MKCSYLLVIICMLGSVAGTPAMAEPDTDIETAVTETTAEPRTKQNKKPKDPARGRFLPIPIFITEPAIGEGLGIALAYFHRTKDLPEGRSRFVRSTRLCEADAEVEVGRHLIGDQLDRGPVGRDGLRASALGGWWSSIVRCWRRPRRCTTTMASRLRSSQ